MFTLKKVKVICEVSDRAQSVKVKEILLQKYENVAFKDN